MAHFIFLKKKRIFFNYCDNLKPTKSIVRECFFSWIFFFIDKLYVLDLFCGSCAFGFAFFYLNAKKILNLDIDRTNISNILLTMTKFNIKNNFNFFLVNDDSTLWIKRFDILNFSLIVFDPPYANEKMKLYFLEVDRLIFFRKCLFLFVESNNFFISEIFCSDWFLIKKKNVGDVIFFLVKKI